MSIEENKCTEEFERTKERSIEKDVDCRAESQTTIEIITEKLEIPKEGSIQNEVDCKAESATIEVSAESTKECSTEQDDRKGDSETIEIGTEESENTKECSIEKDNCKAESETIESADMKIMIDKEDDSHMEMNPDYAYYSEENGRSIYTQPETGLKFVWNETTYNWDSLDENQPEVPAETQSQPVFDGKNYKYTDPATSEELTWNPIKNEWVSDKSKPGEESSEESELESDEDEPKNKVKKQDHSVPIPPADDHEYQYDGTTYTYTDKDGTTYEWDTSKGAWFPKLDEEFLVKYQLNYGFHPDGTINESPLAPPSPPKLDNKKKKKEKQAPAEPTWFDVDDSQNTSVYVSGLPTDITETEFLEVMQKKCGLVMKDDGGKMKIKLYQDSNGELKGDGRCTFIKVESVSLALQLVQGMDLRGHILSVDRATFQMKGDYDPTKRPRKKKKKDKEKLKKKQEKLLDWRPDRLRGERLPNERIVILFHVFTLDEIDKDPKLVLELQADLREECTKFGQVKKVILYDRNPEGVAQVSFKDAEEADICIKALNGRWFAGRRLRAITWDGKTKYRVQETEAELEKRLDNWDKFVGNVDDKKTAQGAENGMSSTQEKAVADNNTTTEKDQESTPLENDNIEVASSSKNETDVSDSSDDEEIEMADSSETRINKSVTE